MPTTVEEIERDILSSIDAGFRFNLVARGQARAMIWKNGILPESSPEFSQFLSYDLTSYAYSLLDLGLRLQELGGNAQTSRLAYEQAAGAIEAVYANGEPDDTSRSFHHIIAAAAYHLGRFSARSYSILKKIEAGANFSTIEKILSNLMLRNLEEVKREIITWKNSEIATDLSIVSFLSTHLAEPQSDGIHASGSDSSAVLSSLELALEDNFLTAVGIFLLAFERGDSDFTNDAHDLLRTGSAICSELNLLPQWWIYRIAKHIIKDIWSCSFHARIPQLPSTDPAASRWRELRHNFLALLYCRPKAEIDLWPSQLDAAARVINQNDDLIVSLPTSSGKTRIAELCILRCLAERRRVVFITPLRALSAQTEIILYKTFAPLGKSVSALYGSIGTNIFDEDVLRERDIIIATPEKLDFALRNDPSLIDDVGLVVLDEGHMIGTSEREVRYEVQIQRLLKRNDAENRRIVCLSAVLPDGNKLDDFVAWLGRDKEGSLIKNYWRPTRLRYGEVIWRGDHARLNPRVGEENPWVETFLTSQTPRDIGRRSRRVAFPNNQRELCLASAWKLVEEGQTVLIYCPQRRSVAPFAKAIVELHHKGLLPSVLGQNQSDISSALTIGKEWLGSDHPILKCLELGIAIHHGALPTAFRKEIEKLLRDNVLKITISSPTLAQGLNLSATVIIMHSLSNDRGLLDISEFKNIIGRAGRAYIDIEGMVLYPIFKDLGVNTRKWEGLIQNVEGKELTSGLLRLVITLLRRLRQKFADRSFGQIVDYIVNNATSWSFPEVSTEGDDQSNNERRRWEQHIATLDTAILSLIGEHEIDDEIVEAVLDQILSSSLWERCLAHHQIDNQLLLKRTLVARTKFIWANSTPRQRRGYFLAGLGLNSGHALDAIANEANELLVKANGSILINDLLSAVEAFTELAEKIFSIPSFAPHTLLSNWRDILKSWLSGESLLEVTRDQEEDAMQFIESEIIYRLVWGLEAIRVRGIANGDQIDGGLALEDYELGLASIALETGTLNKSASFLMKAGFNLRLAAIKAVQDTGGDFSTMRELFDWLYSDQVMQLSDGGNWPTVDAADMWQSFRGDFLPIATTIWTEQSITVEVEWYDASRINMDFEPVRIIESVNGGATYVASPSYERLGILQQQLNPQRKGLTKPTIIGQGVWIDYFGPDDLLLVNPIS